MTRLGAQPHRNEQASPVERLRYAAVAFVGCTELAVARQPATVTGITGMAKLTGPNLGEDRTMPDFHESCFEGPIVEANALPPRYNHQPRRPRSPPAHWVGTPRVAICSAAFEAPAPCRATRSGGERSHVFQDQCRYGIRRYGCSMVATETRHWRRSMLEVLASWSSANDAIGPGISCQSPLIVSKPSSRSRSTGERLAKNAAR